MSRVIYLISGLGHFPYLLVSLCTLRKHYAGPVDLYAWEESHQIAKMIASDQRLNVTPHLRIPVDGARGLKKNAQGVDRISLFAEMKEVDTPLVYLDADTVVSGSLDELIDSARHHGYVATQFIEWTTQQGIIARRLKTLRDISTIDQRLVERIMTDAYPSLNCGIFSCVPSQSHDVFTQWLKWCWEAKRVFIADEVVQHLLQLVFPIGILKGGRYNCSVRRSMMPRGLSNDDVVIWHGHGHCFSRPDKAPEWSEHWKTMWLQCVNMDIGNVRQWGEEAITSNKYLRRNKEQYSLSMHSSPCDAKEINTL